MTNNPSETLTMESLKNRMQVIFRGGGGAEIYLRIIMSGGLLLLAFSFFVNPLYSFIVFCLLLGAMSWHLIGLSKTKSGQALLHSEKIWWQAYKATELGEGNKKTGLKPVVQDAEIVQPQFSTSPSASKSVSQNTK